MDERLERLSDKVRRGIPIGFCEALEVIDYQEGLKKERTKQGLFAKIWSKKEKGTGELLLPNFITGGAIYNQLHRLGLSIS